MESGIYQKNDDNLPDIVHLKLTTGDFYEPGIPQKDILQEESHEKSTTEDPNTQKCAQNGNESVMDRITNQPPIIKALGTSTYDKREKEDVHDGDELTFGTFRYSSEGKEDGYESDASFTCDLLEEEEDEADGSDEEGSSDSMDDAMDEVDGQIRSERPKSVKGMYEVNLDDIKQWDLYPLLSHSCLSPILRELIKRELTFIDLMMTFQKFRDQCLNHGMVPKDDLQNVFPYLDTIIKCHLQVKADIGSELGERPAAPLMGRVFMKPVPYFKLHDQMICSSEQSRKTLEKWAEKDERIQEMLKSTTESTRLPLVEYISEPFKYLGDMKLIFKRYSESLKDDASEKKCAQASLRSFEDVLTSINHQKEYYDQFQKMIELRPFFKRKNIEIMEAHRQLLIDSKVLLPNPQKATASEVDALLFSDILIFSKKSFYETWMISVTVLNLKDTFITQEGKRIILYTPQRVVEVVPKQPHYSTWIKSLRESCNTPIRNPDRVIFDGSRAPRLIPPKAGMNCVVCKAVLQPAAKVKHCFCCGKVVCGDCKDRRITLNYDPLKPKRTCELCYRRLTVKSK